MKFIHQDAALIRTAHRKNLFAMLLLVKVSCFKFSTKQVILFLLSKILQNDFQILKLFKDHLLFVECLTMRDCKNATLPFCFGNICVGKISSTFYNHLDTIQTCYLNQFTTSIFVNFHSIMHSTTKRVSLRTGSINQMGERVP